MKQLAIKIGTATVHALAILGLIAILFSAPPAEGQVFPEEYAGDVIQSDECFGVILEVTDWLDRNFWGQQSPVGLQYYGQICPTSEKVGSIRFEITYAVRSRCTETPWGSPFNDEPECRYTAIRATDQAPRLMTIWSGVYVSYVIDHENAAPYEAITWDSETETGTYRAGTFEFVPPLWFFESDGHTRTVYSLKRFDGELGGLQRAGQAKRLRQ